MYRINQAAVLFTGICVGALFAVASSASALGFPVTPLSGGGTATSTFQSGSVVFSDGTKLTEDHPQFFWDNVNNRLGIGSSTPDAELSIHAPQGSTNLNLLEVGSSTVTGATTTPFIVTNRGFVGIGTDAPGVPLQVNGTSDLTGAIEQSGTITSGNFASNSASSVAHITTAQYLLKGATGVGYRVQLGGGTTNSTLTANDNYAGVVVPQQVFAEASSGNHPILAALGLKAFVATAGSATVSTTSTLYIDNYASSTVASGGNFAFYVANGPSWFADPVTFASTTASSTINLLTANAFSITGQAGGCAQFGTGGYLTSTGTACGGGAGAFPFTPTTFGPTAANATSTLLGFTQGLYALASSTIGNGTQNGGLTVSGGATTTGNAYIAGSVGIGTTSPAVQLDVKGAAYGECQPLTDGSTITVDWSAANCFYVTVTSSRTLAFSNVYPGETIRIFVTQGGSGSNSLTYPSSVNWPGATTPTLATTVGRWDILSFTTATSSATISGAPADNF